jgi:hypothetical protein
MEFVSFQVEVGQLLVAHVATFRVGRGVELHLDGQRLRGARAADEVDDDLVADEELADFLADRPKASPHADPLQSPGQVS